MAIIHECPDLIKKYQFIEFYKLKEWHLIQKDFPRAYWRMLKKVTICPECETILDVHIKPFTPDSNTKKYLKRIQEKL